LILFDSLEVGSSILGFEVLAILDRRGTAALRDPSAAVEDAIFQTKTTKIQILLVVPWYDTSTYYCDNNHNLQNSPAACRYCALVAAV
jgi:hypothetical protein